MRRTLGLLPAAPRSHRLLRGAPLHLAVGGRRTVRVRLVLPDDEQSLRGLRRGPRPGVPPPAAPRTRPGVRHLAGGVAGAAHPDRRTRDAVRRRRLPAAHRYPRLDPRRGQQCRGAQHRGRGVPDAAQGVDPELPDDRLRQRRPLLRPGAGVPRRAAGDPRRPRRPVVHAAPGALRAHRRRGSRSGGIHRLRRTDDTVGRNPRTARRAGRRAGVFGRSGGRRRPGAGGADRSGWTRGLPGPPVRAVARPSGAGKPLANNRFRHGWHAHGAGRPVHRPAAGAGGPGRLRCSA